MEIFKVKAGSSIKFKFIPFLIFTACSSYFIIFLIRRRDSSFLFSYVIWSNGSFSIDFSIYFDLISVVFISTVILIGSSVLTYCYWYISDEVYYNRFIYMVVIFLIAIIFIIFIPNVFSVILGWDGLGLTSFLLVCYYQNDKSLSAGMLTALTNRIGDVLILLSIRFMFSEGRWYIYNFFCFSNMVVFSCLLLFAGITKSAQFPFCAWLPAAIAAPTPVSALVHSSTLVTAGVYILIRSYYIISHYWLFSFILQILRVITLLLARTSAIICIDVKKIVALSTLSQLRLIIFSLRIGIPFLSFFHLITHAMFKALLFLSVGSVIHSNKNIQDIRILGSGWVTMPVSMSVIVVANRSLSGLPFLRGFFSKDLIIDMLFSNTISALLYYLCFFGALFTGLYCMRITWIVFFSINKLRLTRLSLLESYYLLGPYLCLRFGSIFLGFILRAKVEVFRLFRRCSDYEILGVSFLFLVSLFYFLYLRDNKRFSPCVSFLNQMWYIESLTRQPISNSCLDFGAVLVKSLEKGWLEFCGPQGIYITFCNFSSRRESYQNNYFIKCFMVILLCSSIIMVFSCFYF